MVSSIPPVCSASSFAPSLGLQASKCCLFGGSRGTNFINFLTSCIASFLSTSPTIYTPFSLVTESSKNDRAIAAMAHELRQLVDTANAPIFGIGKYRTNDPKNYFGTRIVGHGLGGIGDNPNLQRTAFLVTYPFLGVLLCFSSILVRA